MVHKVRKRLDDAAKLKTEEEFRNALEQMRDPLV